jgi:hypothetical protein
LAATLESSMEKEITKMFTTEKPRSKKIIVNVEFLSTDIMWSRSVKLANNKFLSMLSFERYFRINFCKYEHSELKALKLGI